MIHSKKIPLAEAHDRWDVLDEIITRHLGNLPSSLAAGCPDKTKGMVENIARDVCNDALADCRELINEAKKEITRNSFKQGKSKCC